MRVLVVEDDAESRFTLSELLAQYFDVASAADGHAALEAARTVVPDLILLDAVMPGMNGAEFLERRVQFTGLDRVPVILMTGMPPDRVENCGAVDVLQKPFSFDELLTSIESALA